MQQVSSRWRQLVKQQHETEMRLLIAGHIVTAADIFRLRPSLHLFPDGSPTAGNAVCGTLETEFKYPNFEIPRQGEVIPQVRLVQGIFQTEWLDQGHYFIDTRKQDHCEGLRTLHVECFDAMAKAEADCPLFDLDYPAEDRALVEKIAESMGVSVDLRTLQIITKGYKISATAGYSKREVLAGIAGMYGGTWIMSPKGQLYMVRMTDIPQSSGYLITEDGRPITFGGVKIIVG